MSKKTSWVVIWMLFFCFFFSVLGSAIEFQPIGFESLSMGGAGVASAKGVFSIYYNPALLAEHRHKVEISLSAGIGGRELNLVEHIDRLAEIGIEETFEEAVSYIRNNPIPPIQVPDSLASNIETIQTEIKSIPITNGIQLMPTASLGAQIGNFGFGIFGLSEATAYAVIDQEHLEFIIDTGYQYQGNEVYARYDENNQEFVLTTDESLYNSSSLEYAISNGLTYLQLSGLAYLEVPIAYAHSFKGKFGTLDIGAAIKVMPGWTFDTKIDIDTASEDISSALEDAYKTDTSWGIDLGVLYKPVFLPGLKLGVVGKNLNTPKFETASGKTYKITPMARMGIAYDFPMLTFAFDADLTQNKTFIPGYYSRLIGGGVNFHPFSWFSIRAGVMKNVAEAQDGLVITGGLGFGLKWLQLDIAVQGSTKEGEYKGTSYPRYLHVQVSLVSKWF